MGIAIVVCFILAVSQAHTQAENYRDQFSFFKKTYKKFYATQEEHDHRFNIFVENMEKAAALQIRERGSAQYGVTKFSDLSDAEFKQAYLGLKPEMQRSLPPAQIPDIEIPKRFDWRKKKVVTGVKDQGKCGSCWAFSTTGNIESLWAIKHNKLVSLSEQELVDCDTNDVGCSGGFMTWAYEAIVDLGGLQTEAGYPYKAQRQNCTFDKTKIVVSISGGVNISSDEKEMAKWLYKNGPISIGMDAENMKHYKKGIAHPTMEDCDPHYLNHGVLIVGYGIQNKTPFWIVKNSWGTNWGEKGYYRVYRGDGTCGINRMVSSATL